jgi:hypothetical protein
MFRSGGMLRVSNGEHITKASSVADIGINNMDLINKYGSNGLVSAASNIISKKISSPRFDMSSLGKNANSVYNNSGSAPVIYLTNNITASPGMDTELLAMRVVDMTKKAIASGATVTTSKIGSQKEFGSRVMNT